ncbi:hypothetical protein GGS23DRAFT_566588 [Durotheca rogersii]|uniref:uncharacterized protein n=1 Tax=Durotheca rogersii TaxID=419775 RepID=UPI00221F5727|nr:uncharacterized protein GGS23DRAFT_566588 [Durotheca rogersii]KAI5863368.1 hypothetical protein GGS23DRAFT_566588 [Durotheca rogersii]
MEGRVPMYTHPIVWLGSTWVWLSHILSLAPGATMRYIFYSPWSIFTTLPTQAILPYPPPYLCMYAVICRCRHVFRPHPSAQISPYLLYTPLIRWQHAT